MFKIVRKEFLFGKELCVLETGRLARQATSSVLVQLGSNTVLVAVVAGKKPSDKGDFLPLSVHYQEKTYAAGRIPGGFNKREGRPSEKETLTSRLIDRPIRPLFDSDFNHEVQINAVVLSTDKKSDPDIAALIATSAALAISGLPMKAVMCAARVGFINDEYVLNPSYLETADSLLDLVVAGTDKAVLMVESEAKELLEDEMLGAVLFGSQEMQAAIQAIKQFAAEVGVSPIEWKAPSRDTSVQDKIAEMMEDKIALAYQITDKMSRYTQIDKLKLEAVNALCPAEEVSIVDQKSAQLAYTSAQVKTAFSEVEKKIVRENILNGLPRIDGRDNRSVRPISIEIGVLDNAHGSALFTRGETQALVVTTLGSNKEGQLIDALEGVRTDGFMLHYNFPQYSVGELGSSMGPKRREIGHGRLARRGVQPVLPSVDEFPFVVRVVSEILESNGSSSMASVCGASLSLMDAGVPIKAPVSGIAMGLVKEGNRFAVLTDILGDEDHLGDMDFKVTGTEEGITALQMDIKIEGITEQIMEIALNQAKEGRLHILGEMSKVISVPKSQTSDHAPHYVSCRIDTDKIRDVIGKGGATIRALCEETKAVIDIEDTGLVKIFGQDKRSAMMAMERIKELTVVPIVGEIYEGTVVRLLDFGAFVNFLPGTDGLVHISQISQQRVERISDFLEEGQRVRVKVIEVDPKGRIKLSIKEVG